ncbi:MAG: ABC transporter ATP-binding protein, partial [Halobacteriota archaeon]
MTTERDDPEQTNRPPTDNDPAVTGDTPVTDGSGARGASERAPDIDVETYTTPVTDGYPSAS